jgi:hypothetical protein
VRSSSGSTSTGGWAEEQKASVQAGKEAPSCQEVDTNAAEKDRKAFGFLKGRWVLREILFYCIKG